MARLGHKGHLPGKAVVWENLYGGFSCPDARGIFGENLPGAGENPSIRQEPLDL